MRAYQIENKRIVCRSDSLLAKIVKGVPHKLLPQALTMEAARVEFDTTTYVQIFLKGNQNG